MNSHCHSCAAPLENPGFQGPSPIYCRFCSDETGKLRSKKEVRAGIAEWMMTWQPGLDEKEAEKRAKRYMRTMPAWAE